MTSLWAGWSMALAATLVALALHARGVRRAAHVARAAHELRGPLCAARLALHGAADDLRRVAAAEAELRRAGLALEDLAGRRAVEVVAPVDVSVLVEELAVAWRPLAARHGAALRVARQYATPAPVRGDRLRLAQALANLVANAAEHGRGDVEVAVRASPAHVRVEVRDGGPGPAPARLAAARRPRGRRAGGARGHGLVVAAQVAARHGGRLLVVPTPSGASVVFELPRLGPDRRAARARGGAGLRAVVARRRGPVADAAAFPDFFEPLGGAAGRVLVGRPGGRTGDVVGPPGGAVGWAPAGRSEGRAGDVVEPLGGAVGWAPAGRPGGR